MIFGLLVCVFVPCCSYSSYGNAPYASRQHPDYTLDPEAARNGVMFLTGQCG
jgi:hypothetical protein